MAKFTYWLNGYALGSQTAARGIWLLDATEYAPALSPRRAVVEIPGVHYQVPMWGDPMSAITVAMRIRIKGSSPDDLRTLWDTFIGLLGVGRYDASVLRRERNGVFQAAEAQLLSTDTPDFRSTSNVLDVTVVFNIPGGCWRSETEVEETLTIGTGTSTVAAASTMPIVDALVQVQGPVTTMSVVDNTTDTGIAWGGGTQVVAAGQWLLINVSTMQAWIKSANDWNLSGTVANASLTFQRKGSLVLGSKRSGVSATVSTSITTAVGGGSGPVKIRAKSAGV